MPAAHSQELVNKIRSLSSEGMNDREIGEKVDLTKDAVYKIRKNHEIPAWKRQNFSREQIDTAHAMACAGASDREIGEALRLSKASVYQLRQRHGIEPGKKPQYHQHGTPSMYRRGCRCDDCKAAEKIRAVEVRARRLERFRAGEVEIAHGRSGYTNWGCRCEVCNSANAEECREYDKRRRAADPAGAKEREKARRLAGWDRIREDNDRRLNAYQAETLDNADRYGQVWTTRDLEILGRRDLTVKEVALMLGRSYHAVRTRRTRLFRGEQEPGPVEVRAHGLTGYNQGCRCGDCVEGRHAYVQQYQERQPREVQADAAANRKKEWTGAELEMAARDDLSVREIALRLGRSYAAVTAVRHKIKHDPKTVNFAGLPRQQNRDT